MNRRSMIALGTSLVVLLGGAAGAFYYVDHKKTTEEASSKAEQESLKLFSFDSNTVESIDITNSEGYFHLTFGESGDWVLDETDYPFMFTPDSYYLNVIAASMSRLTADHKAENSSDLSKYGLDSPVTVMCHTSDKDYTLLVGNSTATNEFCYVKLPDDDTVYCIANETGEQMRGEIENLRDSAMLDCYDNEIMRFALVHNGETCYDLSRMIDGNVIWKMNAPQTDVTIDATTVNSILTNMVRVESEKFECFTKDQSELAKYGLDKPAYTFTVETEDKTIVIDFPEFKTDDEEVWCYDRNTCALYTLSQGGAAFLSGKWSDLTIKQALSVPFMDAVSLEMTVDGESHTLLIDHEMPTYIFDDIDVTALGSKDAASNFEYLYASVSEIKHGDFRDDIPEEMGEPECSFVYTLADGTKRELALVPIDDENYWAYVDGNCIGMTVEKNAITSSNGCLNFVERLTADIEAAGSGN